MGQTAIVAFNRGKKDAVVDIALPDNQDGNVVPRRLEWRQHPGTGQDVEGHLHPATIGIGIHERINKK